MLHNQCQTLVIISALVPKRKITQVFTLPSDVWFTSMARLVTKQKLQFSAFWMPDLLAADLSPFWPTHSASAPTGTHTHTHTHTTTSLMRLVQWYYKGNGLTIMIKSPENGKQNSFKVRLDWTFISHRLSYVCAWQLGFLETEWCYHMHIGQHQWIMSELVCVVYKNLYIMGLIG